MTDSVLPFVSILLVWFYSVLHINSTKVMRWLCFLLIGQIDKDY